MNGKQMICISAAAFAVATLLVVAVNTTHAAPIPVPNGDFEDWQAVGDGSSTNAGWASGGPNTTTAGDGEGLGANDEFWSNPSSFGSGWTQLTGRRTDGRWGLQHPNGTNQHARDVANVSDGQDNALDGPNFSGHFIGFANLDADDIGNGTGPQEVFEIQSQILGQLQPGVYTGSLDVGFRFAAASGANPWNDHRYDISLVAGGVTADGTNGSTGGTVLGTPGSIDLTLALGAMGLGANQTTVNYVLTVPPGHANLGDDFAFRIHVENLGTRDGVASPNGTNDFTQANFDNARLDYVIPEPASALLIACGMMAAATLRRKR